MVTVTSDTRTKGIRGAKFGEYIISRLKLNFVTATFGSSETYATGGIAVLSAIKTASGINNPIVISPIGTTVSGYVPYYNQSTGKIQFFGTGSSAGALGELANNSSAISDKTVSFMVLGI